MKILHTADWHIGQFKGPVVDGVNLRSQDTVKCLEYMVQVAIEEKPDIVCVSGDIFHQEQVGPVRYSDEMITATNIITSLAHFSKHVIVMRGTPNHDGAAQFRVLERMLLNIRNVDVVTEPGVIKTPWADIACLPGFDKQEFRAKFPGLSADEENLAWTKYISDMVFALRAECEKTPILMAHYTVVVIVDHKDKAKNIYGTVTHNRARGTHLLEPMKKIVKELMDEGKTVEEIGKQLGMRPEEIFRLSDFSKEDFLKMMTKGVTGYSKAEFITKI